MEELRALGRDDMIVVVGGVIPPQDYAFLYDAGVAENLTGLARWPAFISYTLFLVIRFSAIALKGLTNGSRKSRESTRTFSSSVTLTLPSCDARATQSS